ncbi:hypothetical protein [Luteimonas terricola]|uniref:hypothetical protein n=1 Tax=Luteimonas terricola TaxID=645597 RepID=UPI0010436038|nr:hypothetical protein [Luteimonas terricola]
MNEEEQVARISVSGEGAVLEAAFDPDGQRLAVRYRISNSGDVPLVVFDRGDSHAVLTKRLVAGDVPAPRVENGADGLTLSHAAHALPDPAPTVPPMPLATKLGPGERLDAGFELDLSLFSDAARVRWCLGVMPFDEAVLRPATSAGDVAVWSASFGVVERQQLLCTPWFDVAAGVFEGG